MKWQLTLYVRGYEGSQIKSFTVELDCDKEEAVSIARNFSLVMKRTWNGSKFVKVKAEEGLETFHVK